VSNADTKAEVARGDHENVAPLSSSSQIGHFIKWKRATGHTALLHEAGYLLLGFVSLATLTGLYFWLDVPLVAVAFTYLIVLVLLSLVSNLSSLIVLSFIGVCCLSYFFAPPIYSFRVDYPQDLIIISAFVITTFVVNILVTRVRGEQRDHMRTSETLRDANQRLEVTNEALRIENLERKRAEQAQRESEDKLRQIMDTVPGLIWSADPTGEPTQFNRGLLDYGGIRLEDFQHGGWETFLHPADFPETAKAFYHAIQTGTSYEAVHRLRRSDGEYRWHHARGEPLHDREGRIVQWYGLSVDIDEGKKTEDRLRRSEAYLAEAQRLTHTGSAVYTETEIPYWSDEAARIFGFDPLQGIPSREAVWQRIHPDDLDRVNENIEHAVREKRSFRNDYRIILPDGTIRHIEAVNHPVFSASGKLLEILATGIDVTERKRADDALRESETKIRRLVDSNIIGIAIWDFDGSVLEANDEFLRMVNYDREDLVSGRIKWAELTPPDWRDRNDARIEQQKSSGRFEPFEKEYTRKDGSRVPVLTGGATFEEGGNQGAAFVLDLTERKRAEQALIRSEAYLAETQQLTHTGSWAWDARNERVLYCSEEMLRIFGLDPEEHLPTRKDFRQRVHPEDRNRVDESFAKVINEKVDSFDEYRVVLPDGTVRHVNSSGHPALDGNGELIEFIGTATDVTERKHAEEALRESEAKFSDYAATASDWLWEIDPAYKFTLLTENAFHSDPADRIGTLCWDHALDLETEPEKWRLLVGTLDSRKPFHNFVYCSKDGEGSPMYVKASGKPVFDANGEFRGYRGTGTDVTAIMRAQQAEASLRKAEAEARESEQRYRKAQLELAHANRVATIGQLTASIAHEVNQPITAAVTYALAARRWLNAEPPNFHEVDDALSLIVKEGNRAGDVVGRIRALIKKAPVRKGAVAINDAILEVIALTRTEAANNSVLVRTQLAEDLPHVQGDRVQLQQVLLNLIINAIEAMRDVGEEERELLISSRNEPDGVSVEVRDSGPGFAPAALERVFEAFYTTKPGGLGLGLSICRSIIEAHSGQLWASPNVPRGAIFGFIAPTHPAVAS
jgi:PAS domain S-box-containing protein